MENQISQPAQMDCYGLMYDPYVPPCRDACDIRQNCKEALAKNVREKSREEMQREEISAMERALATGEDVPLKTKMEVQYSEPVMRIVDLLVELGLEIHYKAGYIAAKRGKRNIFSITRAQSPDYDKVVKFIWTREREEFPPEIAEFVSDSRSGDFWTAVAPDLPTLKRVLETYIASLDKK